jgi:hypothetical protein
MNFLPCTRHAVVILACEALSGCGVTAIDEAPLTPAGGTPDARQVPDPVGDEGLPLGDTEAEVSEREANEQTLAEAEPRSIPRSCPRSAQAANEATDPATSGPPKPTTACYPEPAFVERLCKSSYPGAALVMFSKGSPWVRAYLKGPFKAWTTSASAPTEERMFFREEVLVLEGTDGPTEFGTSQGASFYALRWNGSCVKLNEEEVTFTAPWNKLAAPVTWKWLDNAQQDALRADTKIEKALSAMKKQCRGMRMGRKSVGCENSETRVTEAIAAYVRKGAELPDPSHQP